MAVEPSKVSVKWDNTIIVSKTVPTVFVNPQPPGKPGADEGLRQITKLDARNMRYQAFPTPLRQLIPAMTPPTADSTSWDFTMMDAVAVPFLNAVKGGEPVFCLPPPPPWVFRGHDPDAPEKTGVLHGKESVEFDALTISELRDIYTDLSFQSGLVDPSGEQLAEYFARVIGWYVQGGFTDEIGRFHRSGHNFDLPWIEVLNEVQWVLTAEQYVVLYDAIVSAVRRVSPSTQFIGLALGPFGLAGSEGPARDTNIKFFEYFLNPENHRPDTPLDMVSYHFYAVPAIDQTLESWQYSVFDLADGFLNSVAFLERIRLRLSPATKVNISELGIILPHDFATITALVSKDPEVELKIATSQSMPSPAYWNLNAAWFAYLFVELAKQGIDIVTASELMIGNSRAFPSINLVDPRTGEPNARVPGLRLLIDNFKPGDRLIETRVNHISAVTTDVSVQAFDTTAGRKLLVINKRMRSAVLDLSSVGPMRHMEVVDEASGGGPPRREVITGTTVHLDAFAVGVIALDAQ